MHWLAYHILGLDQELSRQIETISSGMSPDEAFDIEDEKITNSAEPLLLALKGLFKQISNKNKKLIDLNRTLEEKVQQRTEELSNLNRHLEQLSFTDPLTGLGNRRYIMTELAKQWNKSILQKKSLSCVMIDADNFKIINDKFGHDAGDVVLTALSKIIKESFTYPDCVGRLGGDEFFVVLPNTTRENALEKAEILLNNVRKIEVKVKNGEWKGSVSLGVSTKTDMCPDYESLIKKADINVYEAKRAGKNCIKGS